MKLSAMSAKLLKTLKFIPKIFLNTDIIKYVYCPVSSFFLKVDWQV